MSTPADRHISEPEIRAGFIPLLDCAPLLVAARMGFAQAEGLRLKLMRETSWATLRDRIAVRHLDVAHMLAPIPIADALGLTPLPIGLIAPMALGFGGNTVTVSGRVWSELRGHGARDDFDPLSTANAFAGLVRDRAARGADRVTLGIVHPYSAHHYGLAYWLASAGVLPGRDLDLTVVPPPLSAAALAAGRIDGFCVGEPWGTVAVQADVGVTITTNAHIWRSGPEKVLGVRRDWAEADHERLHRLLRAVYRAALWCDTLANRAALAELLAEEALLDQPVAALQPGLHRQLIAPSGSAKAIDGFLTFADHAATFPWVSHAKWMFTQMVRWGQVSYSPSNLAAAAATYRPDLYRAALSTAGAAIPIASSKLEGALVREEAVAAASGRLTLGPDGFFDGGLFDPDQTEAYVAGLLTARHPTPPRD